MNESRDLKSILGRLRPAPGGITTVSIVLLAMIVIGAIVSPYFLSQNNLQSVIRDLAFGGMIALAMSMLLLVGELDLSVGTTASLCGVLGGMMMVNGINPWLAFVLAIALGALFGAINGLLTTLLRLNSLVVTIGTSGVYGGIALVLTKGRAVTGLPRDIEFLGKGSVAGIPTPFFFTLALLAALVVVLKYTRPGRYVYAIGNSIETAKVLGIRTDRVRLALFTAVGAISGLAGMLYVARLGSSQTSIGGSWAINAVAACVIGGIALTGGIGSPAGALVGAAIIAIIQDLIVLIGVNVYWQAVVSGTVLVVAIALSSISTMARDRRERRRRLKAATSGVAATPTTPTSAAVQGSTAAGEPTRV